MASIMSGPTDSEPKLQQDLLHGPPPKLTRQIVSRYPISISYVNGKRKEWNLKLDKLSESESESESESDSECPYPLPYIKTTNNLSEPADAEAKPQQKFILNPTKLIRKSTGVIDVAEIFKKYIAPTVI